MKNGLDHFGRITYPNPGSQEGAGGSEHSGGIQTPTLEPTLAFHDCLRRRGEVKATEIAVIEEFLPKQMTEAEAKAAIAAAVKEAGATSPKEMGKVMSLLKERHAGRMDFGKASGQVKELLSGKV